MTVTFPLGFRAAGVAAGLKKSGNPDLAVVVNDGPSRVGAAVFTSNRAQANPIIWSKNTIRGGQIAAIVLNSGGANCFTGEFGYETTALTAEAAAAAIGVKATEIQVCSTGLIGSGGQEFRDAILTALPRAAALADGDGGEDAAEAILTTDTHAKTATFDSGQWKIGAMAKGAGMLAPGLATMLVVITTDAKVTVEAANAALKEATSITFDRLDSDGCMSTNDQVTLLVSGASEVEPDQESFTQGLAKVCLDLAMQLLSDAEGASHDIAIRITGAASEEDALEVGRAVARNNLFKAAIFGEDPNWGRVLAAVGTTSAEFDPYNIDVSMNGVRVCTAGRPDRPREEVDLTGRQVNVDIDLQVGSAAATIWTNDLTHDYVHENSAYSS